MNWRAVFAIVRKDMKVVLQNKGVVIPIIAVPLIIFGIMPWLASLAPNMIHVGGSNMNELTTLINAMPAGLQAELAAYTPDQQTLVFLLVYLLAPLFLVIPLMVSSTIAADSIAGERERRTLEALLYSPTSDQELFLAKLLSAWLAALFVSTGGFLLYTIMVNAACWSVMGRLFFPNWMWVALTFWVSPAAAGLGLSTMVLISGRAQGFQDAYQTGSAVVLPVLLLLFGQISGVMYFSLGMVMLIGLALWAVDLALIRIGSRAFRRSRLIIQLS